MADGGIALALPDDLIEALVARVAERVKPAPRFLSKVALAAHLGVQPRTIRTWRERGLPGIRVGREVMYPVEEVERWIETHG